MDSLRRRYHAEDQEFLRREIRLTGRWLFRGGGAPWIAGYAALLIVQSLIAANVRPNVTGYGSLLGAIVTTAQFSWIFALPTLFSLMAWIHALQTRTFDPLAGDRGRALVLTELRADQLWPALLAGPIGLKLSMSAIGGVAGFLTHAYWLFTEGPPDPGDSVAIRLVFHAYGTIAGFFLYALQSAAATAWAARWIHPGGGWFRTGLGMAAAAFAFYALNAATVFLSQAFVFQGLDRFFALNLRDTGLLVPYHLAFLPGVVFRAALFGGLFWMGVRALRSHAAAEAWRARLEP